MTPQARDGVGVNLPHSRRQRLYEHARNMNRALGVYSKIETWFIDDLIEEMNPAEDSELPPLVLTDFCKETGLTYSTIQSYMSAARFYTKQERQAVDPDANFIMSVWKTAYELSETDSSEGLPKAMVLKIIRDFVKALDNGGLYYDDEQSKGISPTGPNLKQKLRDELEFYTGGVEPSVSREFLPTVPITVEQANAARDALNIAERTIVDGNEYDLFGKLTIIRKRRREK